MRTTLTLEPGQTRDVRVLFGAAHDVDEVRDLVTRHRGVHPLELLDEVKRDWDARLGSVQVDTPDRAFDLVMNGWLLYQTLACRMLARCGFHQTSGAYGFRDQLQDGMAAVLVDPSVTRSHLLRAAARQFTEGDVQHWWLPSDGSGVRTRISDDVVWLSHAVARYVKVTGDTAVLDEVVPYLEGATLGPDEHESFFLPTISDRSDTLYAHCVKGIERAFRFGVHGLPLMGTGDWNDGMNRVGVHGQGESVWLGWFLHRTLTDLMPLAKARGDRAFVTRCQHEQSRLHDALEEHGWDGAWYRRGYFDDGTPLGSAVRPECRIDSIAQSWAVLSGAAIGDRGASAMDEVDAQLVMKREGVARLFTPPFDESWPDPGLHQGLPARNPGERRAVHPRGDLVDSRVCRVGARGQSRCTVLARQPGQPHAHSGSGRHLQGRAVRHGRGRLLRGAARRAGRLDVVHRVERVDVPGRPRGDSRVAARRREPRRRAVPAAGLDHRSGAVFAR